MTEGRLYYPKSKTLTLHVKQEDENEELTLRHREEQLKSASQALESQQSKVDAAHRYAEDLMQSLLDKNDDLESQREALDSEKDAVAEEREAVSELVGTIACSVISV